MIERRFMGFTRKTLGDVYEGCAGECYYCGDKLSPFGDWEPDHMLPVSQGGTDDLFNLVASCRACNRSKGGRTVDEYRREIILRIEKHLWAALKLIGKVPMPCFHDEQHLLNKAIESACDWARVTEPIFSGEWRNLPRDAYAPHYIKQMSPALLDDPKEAETLNLFEKAYLRALKGINDLSIPESASEN
jgi:hypothetical protein